MWPDLGFSEWRIKDEKIFFKTSNEIKRVVSQGITATILVKLPGFLTNVILYFPVPSLVKVYLWNIRRGAFYFVGKAGDGDRFYRVSKRAKYQYSVEFPPWMYDGCLKTKVEAKTRIVHYVIENCSSGFDGVLLKFRDELDSQERNKEWFKVFWFGGGNEYHFWNEKHKEILELLPVRQENMLFWEPKEGWEQLKRMRSIPAKIR